MITFLVSDLNRNPLRRLIGRTRGHLPAMQTLTYDRAFRRLQVPGGTLVFTDFDLLTDFELDAAGAIAAAAKAAGPVVRVLNTPSAALERAAMLRHLHSRGLNAVEVTRIEDEKPRRYPVFIRLQGGCERPDTGLLHTEEEYQGALDALRAEGRSLRGRIAVSYEAAPDAAGHFRKFGAFRVGDHIVPQHILRGTGWYVKRSDKTADDAFAEEELAYVRDNPHKDTLLKLFDAAGYQYGRADYTIRNGEVVLFEINSNPSYPNLTRAWKHRSTRHQILMERLDAAFRSIDLAADGRAVPFDLNLAIGHNVSRRRWNPLVSVLWKRRLTAKSKRAAIGWGERAEAAS